MPSSRYRLLPEHCCRAFLASCIVDFGKIRRSQTHCSAASALPSRALSCLKARCSVAFALPPALSRITHLKTPCCTAFGLDSPRGLSRHVTHCTRRRSLVYIFTRHGPSTLSPGQSNPRYIFVVRGCLARGRSLTSPIPFHPPRLTMTFT